MFLPVLLRGLEWFDLKKNAKNLVTFHFNNYTFAIIIVLQLRLPPLHLLDLTLGILFQNVLIQNNIYGYILTASQCKLSFKPNTIKVSNRTVSTLNKENADPGPNLKKQFLRVQKEEIRTKLGSGNNSFFHIQFDNCLRAFSHINQLYLRHLSK